MIPASRMYRRETLQIVMGDKNRKLRELNRTALSCFGSYVCLFFLSPPLSLPPPTLSLHLSMLSFFLSLPISLSPPSLSPFVCVPACLPAYLLVCLSVCLPICLCACLPAFLPVCLSVSLSVCVSGCVCVWVCLSLSLSLSRSLSLSLFCVFQICVDGMRHNRTMRRWKEWELRGIGRHIMHLWTNPASCPASDPTELTTCSLLPQV